MTRTPAEWEQHERTIMGWPCRTELWGGTLAQAREDYAAVANAVHSAVGKRFYDLPMSPPRVTEVLETATK